jgi:PAS domain S-box-containing protein
VSEARQALWFDAVPLLVLAAACAFVALVVARTAGRSRVRPRVPGAILAAVFSAVAVLAAVLGALVVDERRPLGGDVWVSFAATLVALAPVLLLAARGAHRLLDPHSPHLQEAAEAAEVTATAERRVASLASVSSALSRADDAEAVARLLLDEVRSLFGVEFAALVLVDDDGRRARGLAARDGGGDVDWFPSVSLDLEHEPSGVASAVFEAAPFAVYDARSSSRVNARLVERTGARSLAYVPLVAKERVIAVLVAAATGAARAFAPEELQLMQALAGEAALALERSRSTVALSEALAREQRRIEQQTALLRAAEALTSELEVERVLARLVQQVAALLGADAADCYLLDAERGTLRCAAVYGFPAELLEFEFPAERGVAGAAIAEGRPVVSSQYEAVAAPVPHDAYAGFTSVIVAPMRWSDTIQGVLGVGARGTRTFTAEDTDLLQAYAGLASLALGNAQAFDDRSRQARIQRGFYRIASVLSEPLSLAPTLDAVAQAATEAFGATFAAVLAQRAEELELRGGYDLPDAVARALDHGLPQEAGCLAVAARDGRVLASPDVSDDDRFGPGWTALAERAGWRALLAIPVSGPREEDAGLVVVFFAEPRRFTDEDLELTRHLARATRGALERSELFEAERTARTLAQQLARTGSLVATELDPTAVTEEVVVQAAALLDAEACAIRVFDDDGLTVCAAWGDDAEAAIGTRSSSTALLSGDVFQSRSPVAIGDASADQRLTDADAVLAAGYAAFLGVPLTGPEGFLHGVLAVYARRPRTWRPEEIEALQALAANTSAALSNAELYSRVSIEKERSEAILANIADGIVAVDREGEVVLWNAAAEQITGVPAEEALGRTPQQVLQRRLEAGAGDEQTSGRLVSIARDGEEVWLSLSEAVMRDPVGGVAGRIFAFRDISADRFVEQMKSDFVSTVSHQLRTPLTSIYGFAETMLRQDVLFGEEERRTFLGYIASESERLTGIVDELLNVARLDTGELQVTLDSIDVASVVSEVVAGVEEAGTMNGHVFVVDLPTEPLRAEADRDKLRQVFAILVDNALRYSPDGGTVTVGARRYDDRVEVRIIDEGVGIPAAERERIFRKFYHPERAAGPRGSGLGLFIARGLVTAMGGRIWVDSVEGRGSSFAFELPAARA